MVNELLQIAVVGLLPLQFGLHMAILNDPMDHMGCQGVESRDQDCIKGWSPALPSSVYALGGLLGSAVVGPLIRKYGLRKTVLLCAAVFTMGSLLVSSSTTYWQIVFARLITGVAAGGAIVVAPILTKKLSPPKYAGILGTSTQFNANSGIIIAQLLGLFFAENHWRRIMWSAFLISLASTVLAYFSVSQVNDKQHDEESTDTAAEPVSETSDIQANLLDLFKYPRYRYTMITTISIFAVQQLTGINSIIQYGAQVLTDTMPDQAKEVNLCLSQTNLAATSVAAVLIGKFGRKQMLLTSLALMSLCTATLAFSLVRGLAGLSVLASFATIASFAIGIGPIPFMYVGEFAPTGAVDAAQSLGTVSSWLSTFAVVALFPTLQAALGPSVFYFFSICSLAAAVVYFKWLNEDRRVVS